MVKLEGLEVSHTRKRQILQLIEEKLKYSPVLVLQGVRQCGKSFFIREILSQNFKNLKYVTLDNTQNRDSANRSPGLFLDQHKNDSNCLAVDEAQKAPDLFDSVKERVDLKKRPAQYILLGSTEFSHRTKIRESLTGRASRAQLYPFNLSETQHLPLTTKTLFLPFHEKCRVLREHTLKYLERGGLPGIFSIRNDKERLNFFKDWVDLTINRDLHQIKGLRLDSATAHDILRYIATQSETDLSSIAKKLRLSYRKVESHVTALKALFAIYEVRALPEGTGKSQFFLCDVGIAESLGATFEKKLQTWVLIEFLSKNSYSNNAIDEVFTYRTTKGSRIEFVIRDKKEGLHAFKVYPHERLVHQDFEILRAFKKKFRGSKVYGLATQRIDLHKDKITIFEWESIV